MDGSIEKGATFTEMRCSTSAFRIIASVGAAEPNGVALCFSNRLTNVDVGSPRTNLVYARTLEETGSSLMDAGGRPGDFADTRA
jgi:hypothetical protein